MSLSQGSFFWGLSAYIRVQYNNKGCPLFITVPWNVGGGGLVGCSILLCALSASCKLRSGGVSPWLSLPGEVREKPVLLTILSVCYGVIGGGICVFSSYRQTGARPLRWEARVRLSKSGRGAI